jgi:hypothetical protein
MLYIYNPQKSVMFGVTLHLWLLRSRYPCKYGFFLDLYRRGDVGFYCDRNGISLPLRFLNKNLAFLFYRIELKLWLYINNLNTSRRIIHDSADLGCEDILFLFGYEHLQSEERRNVDSSFFCSSRKFKIICHLSHYCFRTRELASNIKKLEFIKLASEGMLEYRNSYYDKFFSSSGASLIWIPFYVQDRFRSSKLFGDRKNKAVATGSFMLYPEMEHTSEFINFYSINTLQPLRKELWENRAVISEFIDVKISCVNEFWKTDRIYAQSFSSRLVSVLYRRARNLTKNWLRHYSKAGYYKQNIVEIYNDYKIVIVSEEVGDLPAIGAFEAMACGCAVVMDARYGYEKMGFIPNVDFIAYDGTLSDLQLKLRYYLSRPGELEVVARNGLNKAMEICTVDKIMKNLTSD